MRKARWLTGMLALALWQTTLPTRTTLAQTNAGASDDNAAVVSRPSESVMPGNRLSLARYVDETSGMTVDEAVARALAQNGELMAARAEIEAARARVRQAGLQANPTLDISRAEQIGGSDNNTMVGASLPLELGGRRAARIRVAERELLVRERMVADRERQLAAEVRAQFVQALAEIRKLQFMEELLSVSQRGYRLVAARVVEGRTAPLEQNMVSVEVNRVRSLRETSEGRVEVAMLELRNLVGMSPEEPLRLRGGLPEFVALEPDLPSRAEATERALRERPDLQAARAVESLAAAQVEQARSGGRIDASLTAQYGRMNFGFPVRGIDDAGRLRPVQDVFHTATVGVTLELPLRNNNRGAIEAAVAEGEAARRRREFGELTVRREVAAAFARYERSARALEIFRTGVRGGASQNLDVIRQTYEFGARTLLDYIAEQRRFIELEMNYIDALLETYLARIEIERASYSPGLITR